MAGGRVKPVPLSATALREVTEAVLAQTTLGVWVLDADDSTTFVNARMAEIVGSTLDELVGAAAYDFPELMAPDARTVVARTGPARGVSALREARFQRPDGTSSTCSSSRCRCTVRMAPTVAPSRRWATSQRASRSKPRSDCWRRSCSRRPMRSSPVRSTAPSRVGIPPPRRSSAGRPARSPVARSA